MLPVISDFFQTALMDNLKSFFQPTYITLASIFTFLNLMFIFPDLVSHNVLFAVSLLNLNSVLQTILIAVIVLVLAYLLLSISSGILAFMTGESWSKSLLGILLKKLQMREWNNLSEQSKKGVDKIVQPEGMSDQQFDAYKKDQIVKGNVARLEKMTRFPEEEEYVGPTALGNVLNAIASYTWQQYQMDMAALWPHMEIAIAKANDTELKTRLDNEKTTLDFLVSLAFTLGLFAIEQVLVQVCWLDHDFSLFGGTFVVLVLAFIVYRAAVVKARTWGSLVQLAFDIHRNDLRMLLGVRDFSSEEDERNTWQKVSSLLLWHIKADDVFVPETSVSIKSSGNIKVETHTSILEIPQTEQETLPFSRSGLPGLIRVYAYIQYMLLISNTEASNNTGTVEGAYLLITDPRIAMIDVLPTPIERHGMQFTVEVMRTTERNKANALLWNIDGLKANGSTVLSYRLPFRFLKATIDQSGPDLTESVDRDNTHTFTLENNGSQDINNVTLNIFDNYKSMPDNFYGLLWASEDQSGDPKEIHPQISDQYRYYWYIPRVAQGNSITLMYNL